MGQLMNRAATGRINGGLIWYPGDDTFRLDDNLAATLGFGETSLMVSGVEFRKRVHPQDLERAARVGRACLTSGKPISLSYGLLDSTNRYRDVKIDGFWVSALEGRPLASCNRVVEIDDVDETKADQIAEHALQIIQLATNGEELPLRAMAEMIMVHLLRQDAERVTEPASGR